MSISGFPPHRAHWAPLSPPSPTSGSVPKRSIGPTNLPSSPAPSNSSVDAPLGFETLSLAGPTPPASVPMSAQQSQTSTTDVSSSGLSTQPSDLGAINKAKGMFDGQTRIVSGSKRKAENEDTATTSKRAKTEESTSAADIQLPTHVETSTDGPYIRVQSQPLTLSQPHSSADLIELYGLGDVAASLARKNASGEKINKLRKSYENYIKDIPGKDRVRREDYALRRLAEYPDDDYYNSQVHGKELSAGLSQDLLGKLALATQIDGGHLPAKEDRYWKDMVDAESAPVKTQAQAPPSGNIKAHDTSMSMSAPSPNDKNRPSRRGVKRRYNDESFEGYTESFGPDDVIELGGPDHIDDADAGSSVKRKKRRDTASSPNFNNFGQQGPSAMGAVSVGNSGYAGR